tara:strand:- start:140 stop:469 length:330 start_codon:yes stop_codon:yes gene_type:complete
VLNQGRLVAQGTETELAGRFHIGGSVDFLLRGEEKECRTVLNGIEQVKKIILLETDGDDLALRVNMTEDVREQLVESLVQNNIGVRGVANAHDELEGIFLDLARLEGDA